MLPLTESTRPLLFSPLTVPLSPYFCGLPLKKLVVHPSESPDVTAARDRGLGVDIIGGFADPINGRDHIIATLEQQLRDARDEQQRATAAANLALRVYEQAEADLASALAAEKYRARTADLRRLETEDLPKARELEAERKDGLDWALENHTQAQSELRGLEAARTQVRKEREDAEANVTSLVDAIGDGSAIDEDLKPGTSSR